MESLPPPFPSEPDPDEEIRRIIGEVAKRHKIVVAPEDPTLTVLTMLELVASRYLERADAMLQTQREGMLGAMERAAGASKTAVEGLVTAAADYHVKTTRGSAVEMAATVTKAGAMALEKIELATKNAQWLLWIGWASLIALFAIAIGVGIGTWISPDVKTPALHCPAVAAGFPPASSRLE